MIFEKMNYKLKTSIVIYFVFSHIFLFGGKTDSCLLNIKAEIHDVTCYGASDGSIDLIVSGNNYISFEWSNGASSEDIIDLIAGIYKLKISYEKCVIDTFFVVNEPDKPVSAKITRKKDVTCRGLQDGELSVIASGGFEPYIYSLDDTVYNPSGELYNLVSGDYTVYVKDKNNCKTEIFTKISEPQDIIIDLGPDKSILSGEETILYAGEGFSDYKWNTGENTSQISVYMEVTDTTSEEYEVEVIDKIGCKHTSKTVKITVIPVISDEDIKINEEIMLEEPEEQENAEFPADEIIKPDSIQNEEDREDK